jgi:hypothetical protein
MTKKKHTTNRRRPERRVIIRGVRRNPVDVQKLSRALIALMQARAEAAAQAEQSARDQASPPQERAQ